MQQEEKGGGGCRRRMQEEEEEEGGGGRKEDYKSGAGLVVSAQRPTSISLLLRCAVVTVISCAPSLSVRPYLPPAPLPSPPRSGDGATAGAGGRDFVAIGTVTAADACRRALLLHRRAGP